MIHCFIKHNFIILFQKQKWKFYGNLNKYLYFASFWSLFWQATHTHGPIDNAADNMKDVLQDLLQTMEEAASQAGVVNSMIDTITKAIAKVSLVLLGFSRMRRECYEMLKCRIFWKKKEKEKKKEFFEDIWYTDI